MFLRSMVPAAFLVGSGRAFFRARLNVPACWITIASSTIIAPGRGTSTTSCSAAAVVGNEACAALVTKDLQPQVCIMLCGV